MGPSEALLSQEHGALKDKEEERGRLDHHPSAPCSHIQ